MKIAIISSSFFESSFPLAKHIGKYNDVTLYCFLNQSLLNPPMLNLTGLKKKGLLSDADIISCLPSAIKAYLKDSSLSIKIVVCGNSKKIGLSAVLSFVKELKKNKFEHLHFIGEEFRFNFIQYFFSKRKIIQTLHEGDIARLTKRTGKLKSILLKLFLNRLGSDSTKLIFHSENVRVAFLKNYPSKSIALTTTIAFGIFELYSYFDTGIINLELPDNYFLFYGYIEQYKGLDTLLEAIKIVNELNRDIKFVVAGRDKDKLVDIGDLKNVTYVNKFLTENEIAGLIKNSTAIIMPYRSASQSGIPNTAFLFNVPIIASNIPGINQIIKDKENGLLFEVEDTKALARCIVGLFDDKGLLNELKDNINKKSSFNSWDKLAVLTTDFYKV